MDNFGDAVPLPDSALFPEGASSAAGVFSFYIPGAGELAQGKSGLNEQRQVNVVNNLSVTSADHQLKFGEWRIQSAVPDRRVALDPVGAEANVLKPEKRRNSILASLKPAKSRMVGHPEVIGRSEWPSRPDLYGDDVRCRPRTQPTHPCAVVARDTGAIWTEHM